MLLALLLAAEDATQGGQVEQLALGGADDQPDVGHQQHDHELQEALRVSRREAVSDDDRKQVGTHNPEYATNGGAD